MKTTRTLLLISIALLALLLFRTCEDNTKATYFYENSGHAIELGRTHKLYNNYKNKIKPSIDSVQKRNIERLNGEYNSTEYVLVSIQQLENYIKFLKEVEKTNKENSNDDKEITGIAIFLGANDEDEEIVNKPRFNNNIEDYDNLNQKNDRLEGDVKGRITMFFAPTFRDTKGEYTNEFARQIPFYIIPENEQDNNYKGEYANLLDFLDSDLSPETSRSQDNSKRNGTSLNADEFNSMPPKR